MIEPGALEEAFVEFPGGDVFGGLELGEEIPVDVAALVDGFVSAGVGGTEGVGGRVVKIRIRAGAPRDVL